MKKIYVCLLLLIISSLVVFTVYGESLYELGMPTVTAGSVVSFFDHDGFAVPLGALRTDGDGADYVYLLTSERGYSRVIHTISRIDVEVTSVDSGQDRAMLAYVEGLAAGARVVLSSDRPLADKGRVLL